MISRYRFKGRIWTVAEIAESLGVTDSVIYLAKQKGHYKGDPIVFHDKVKRKKKSRNPASDDSPQWADADGPYLELAGEILKMMMRDYKIAMIRNKKRPNPANETAEKNEERYLRSDYARVLLMGIDPEAIIRTVRNEVYGEGKTMAE